MIGSRTQSRTTTIIGYTVLVVAVVMVIEFAATVVTLREFAAHSWNGLANVVSMSAVIPETEVNRLAAEFDRKEGDLTLRESALLAREAELSQIVEREISANNKIVIGLLGGTILLILFLIGANFYFDILRAEAEAKNEQKSDSGVSETEDRILHSK